MPASLTFKLTCTGVNMPAGSTSTSVVDTSSNAIDVAGQLVLSGSFQAIAVPAGATAVCLYMPAGNTINITIAGNGADTGINLGNGWLWAKIPVLGGTTTLYAKAASGTPVLSYEFN
jgi:hypothetical protein